MKFDSDSDPIEPSTPLFYVDEDYTIVAVTSVRPPDERPCKCCRSVSQFSSFRMHWTNDDNQWRVWVLHNPDGKVKNLPLDRVFKTYHRADKWLRAHLDELILSTGREIKWTQAQVKREEELKAKYEKALAAIGEPSEKKYREVDLPEGWELVESETLDRIEGGSDYGAERRVLIRKGGIFIETTAGHTGWASRGEQMYYSAITRARGHRRRLWETDILWEGRTTKKVLKEHLEKMREYLNEPDLEVRHIDPRRTLVIPEVK